LTTGPEYYGQFLKAKKPVLAWAPNLTSIELAAILPLKKGNKRRYP